ncbi:U79 protein [macacine betaherpesvirus 9]|uniref:U79 protein n=1 Tax=macacine betaherpesvirus 9 TaxID=2560568 RepID=A0A191S3T9_9BETA|nr:U79 protein [macacine betaherpesvirus 9]ANC96543.1 U79 protein [macacine betaherpesvirus 9]
MIADEREYGTFEAVTQAYQQIISHTLQLKRYEFETGCVIMFSSNSGKCEMLSNGWISIISWTSENDTSGSLTVDICTEGGQCKTYSAKGHILCSKNITSISQKTEGKETVFTVCHENGKLHLTYITVFRSNVEHEVKEQKADRQIHKERADRKKHDEKKHDEESKKTLKQKEKRRLEQKTFEDCEKKDERKKNEEDRKKDDERRNERNELEDGQKEKRIKTFHEKRQIEEFLNEEIVASSSLANGIVEGALSPTLSIDLNDNQELEECHKRNYAQERSKDGLYKEVQCEKQEFCIKDVIKKISTSSQTEVSNKFQCDILEENFTSQQKLVPVCEIKPFIDINILGSQPSRGRGVRGRRRNSTLMSRQTLASSTATIENRSGSRPRGRPRGRPRSTPLTRTQRQRQMADISPIVIDSDSDTETLRRNEDLLATTILQTL